MSCACTSKRRSRPGNSVGGHARKSSIESRHVSRTNVARASGTSWAMAWSREGIAIAGGPCAPRAAPYENSYSAAHGVRGPPVAERFASIRVVWATRSHDLRRPMLLQEELMQERVDAQESIARQTHFLLRNVQ